MRHSLSANDNRELLQIARDRSRSRGRLSSLLGRERRLLAESVLFDADWYADSMPAPRHWKRDPVRHYLTEGAFLGLDPGPDFSTIGYYRANPDVAEGGWPALLHYIIHGQSEGRSWAAVPPPSEEFDADWYLRAYPDVCASGLDPWAHYFQHGRAEGRLPARIEALELEVPLWRGLEARALPSLQRLSEEGSPREKAAAGWVLARWHAAAMQWPACLAALDIFFADPRSRNIVVGTAPDLLAVRAALACGQQERAAEFAARLPDGPGAAPDAHLARLGLEIAAGVSDENVAARLSQIHPPHGLAPIGLCRGSEPPLDRLVTTCLHRSQLQPPKQQPLVSVIVPVFNAAASLPHALEGLVSQSWQRLEIIVVDDASEDATATVLDQWTKRDHRIHLIRHPTNKGAYVARNEGLAAARGDFITVHDADDWSHPDKIAAQVAPLLADKSTKATLSYAVRAGPSFEMTRWRIEGGWTQRNLSSLMIRAELRDQLGYWDRVRAGADTEYFDRLIACFGESSVTEVHRGVPLAFCRTTETSLNMKDATNWRSQFSGPRRAYADAARNWHQEAKKDALFLPQFPAQRPFHAPAALGPADPGIPTSKRDLIAASGLLDSDWYRTAYEDVCVADPDLILHYIEFGEAEDRDPGPCFSTSGYRRLAGLTKSESPLLHWLQEGRARNLSPLPEFPGALVNAKGPVALVCGHAAGEMLFGAERSLLTLLECLRERGFCPVTIVPNVSNEEYFAALQAHSKVVAALPQLWRHLACRPSPETVTVLRDLIRSHGAEIVHVNTLVLDAPLAAARAEGCPSVVHVRELPAQDPHLCRLLGASTAEVMHTSLLFEADRFVANSKLVADWLACPNRTEIWPNQVDPALFDLPYSPGEVLRIALVSSNTAKKGIADFVEVARIVAAEGIPSQFLVIGPETDDLNALRPLPENVEFRGYSQTPLAAIAQADVVMSLSLVAESFGRTILEAMAARRPVITYARGTPASLVEHTRSGLVVPADSPDAAAQAVRKLCTDRSTLMRLSSGARLRAERLQRIKPE